MRSAPGKWNLSLAQHPRFDSTAQLATVIAMIEMLWRAQPRHGVTDPTAPLNVTPQEAETALYLAITLVRWFTHGSLHSSS